MKQLSVPFFKKHSTFFRAAALGGLLGLLYALESGAGAHYGQFRFLPGIIIGTSIGFMAVLSERIMARTETLPFLASLLLKTVLYSIGIALILLLSVMVFSIRLANQSSTEALSGYIEARMAKDLVFSLFASVLLILFLEVSKLLSPRFFFNYFTGSYHRPVQEERIFMFVDLRSSTTIAESLGDLRYSRMLQDLFAIMNNAILASRAQVYQYAGDEIILTWKTASGLKNLRCLYCFGMIRQRIRDNGHYFRDQYGLVPEFKAGMHLGTAVTAWVGTVKKEIAYHGDLLNTTARIQGKCNELGHDFIISGALMERLPSASGFRCTRRGRIELKGKSSPIELYSIDFI